MGPDVRLYIGPDESAEQDTRRYTSHAPYHVRHMYMKKEKKKKKQ